MVLHLAEQLDVPLRDRNHLLLAAGHAPVFDEHDLDEPEMAPVRDALSSRSSTGTTLTRRSWSTGPWEMVAGNRAVALMTAMAAPELLAPPVNALRVSLHPDGMAPRIVEPGRVARAPARTAAAPDRADRRRRAPDAARGASILPGRRGAPRSTRSGIAVPLRLRERRPASWRSSPTVATFGTAVEVTASELAIESFFPANAATAEAMRGFVARSFHPGDRYWSAMSRDPVDVVRMPIRIGNGRARPLDLRLAIRFPRLASISFRLTARLPTGSRLRRALLARTVRLGVEAYNRRDLHAVTIMYRPDLEYYPYREFVESALAEPCYHGPAGYHGYIEATYEVWGTDYGWSRPSSSTWAIGSCFLRTCRCVRRPAASSCRRSTRVCRR